jgi:hypothetical protein
MLAYKLTSATGQTFDGTQWGDGVEHVAPGGSPCSEDVIHWYRTPLMAVFFDPIHGNFGLKARLWECDVDETAADGAKAWGTRCRTIREIDRPVITTEQRVEIAIRCALLVCDDAGWRRWASRWLSGADKSRSAAEEAEAEAFALAAEAEAEAAAAACAAVAFAAVAAACAAEAAACAAAEAAACAAAAAAAAAADVLSVINEVMEGNDNADS